MAQYNTSFDAANTSVRAFLTKVGELYLGRNFNIGAGRAKDDWKKIKNQIFQRKCAYCGRESEKL